MNSPPESTPRAPPPLVLVKRWMNLGQDLSDVMIDLLAERQRLNADLLEAQGDLSAAMAARRAIDIAGYTAEETAAYDANAAIRAQIAGFNAQRAAVDAALNAQRAAADAALNRAARRRRRIGRHHQGFG